MGGIYCACILAINEQLQNNQYGLFIGKIVIDSYMWYAIKLTTGSVLRC